MSDIRLAIAGVGNCASALVQGIHYYGETGNDGKGLMHPSIAGYGVEDITPVCGFDVDQRKVGADIGTAIFASPNCVEQFCAVPAELGAPVYRGPQFDGVAAHTQEHRADDRVTIDESTGPVDVATKLETHNVDVLVCYLPVGATEAVEHYAEAAIEAGVGFVNAMPVFIASDPEWAERFADANVPIVGDDIKSQVGATITHRSLVQMFENRGVDLKNTYQLNVGGNTDFLNMLDRQRLETKKTSKTEAVNELLDDPLDDKNIHVGPSDYVEFLDDEKTAFIKLVGQGFGGSEVKLDLTLRVEDSPNSAGSAVDAIRCAKVAADRGIDGALVGPAAVTMKHPPEQLSDADAMDRFEAFLEGQNRV
jgi:myo-inositol-1-phosphate synthase